MACCIRAPSVRPEAHQSRAERRAMMGSTRRPPPTAYRLVRAAAVGLLALSLCAAFLPTLPFFAGRDFHAAWVDQSPNPTILPGATTTFSIRFRNTGSAAWQRGAAGKQVTPGAS